MANLTLAELNVIRKRTMDHQTMANKLNHYSDLCQDPQIAQLFADAAQSAQHTVTQLCNFIGPTN